MNLNSILIVDTETTGLDDPIEAVEIAYLRLDEDLKEFASFRSLCRPGVAISSGASEIHGITQLDVAHLPAASELLPSLPSGCIWVGHNAYFDRQVMPWLQPAFTVDTCDLARRYFPDLKSHALQELAKEFDIPVDKAHSALSDCQTTATLLKIILKESNLDLTTLFSRATELHVIHFMPWGKFKGRHLSELPWHYLDWLSKQNLEPNLKYSVQTFLNI